MERFVSRAWAVRAIRLAVGLSLISGGALLARQDPPAPAPKPPEQADMLKFSQNTPHLIVWAVKSNKAADFEALWAAIQAQFAKSERPEVKEFAATFTNMYKVNSGAPTTPDAPVVYVFQIDKPSTTVSYNPGKIVYEFLYFVKDGKEGGIARADADAIFAKAGNMQEMFASIVAWPLTKIGS